MDTGNEELTRDIKTLQSAVTAAQEEFSLAIAFHEAWKPMAYDEALHKRMGTSFATHTFRAIRTALRREMLLAVMRIWDSSKKAIRMTWVAYMIRRPDVIDVLADERVAIKLIGGIRDAMHLTLSEKARNALNIINRYGEGGEASPAFKRLRTLRDERLAHRQLSEPEIPHTESTDAEIEAFFNDTAELVSLLLSLVNAHAYRAKDTAEIFERYASEFWAGVKGERTEGHPNYRPAPSPSPYFS